MVVGLAIDEGRRVGRVRVAGFDPFLEPLDAKAELGWAGQETSLYEDLTAEENLRLACTLARVPRAKVRSRTAELLETIGLADRGKERVARYSGGMKRRLHLALAMVHDPRLLLLDEPLVGVDPQARAHLITIIERLAAGGRAVLLTADVEAAGQREARSVGEALDERTDLPLLELPGNGMHGIEPDRARRRRRPCAATGRRCRPTAWSRRACRNSRL